MFIGNGNSEYCFTLLVNMLRVYCIQLLLSWRLLCGARQTSPVPRGFHRPFRVPVRMDAMIEFHDT